MPEGSAYSASSLRGIRLTTEEKSRDRKVSAGHNSLCRYGHLLQVAPLSLSIPVCLVALWES